MKFLVITFLAFTGLMFAQSSVEKFTPQLNEVISKAEQNEELLVWVFFTDKGNQIQSYFSNPTGVVSERSLKRRAKVFSESNLINERDLPVNQNYVHQAQLKGLLVKQRTKWFNGVSGFATKSELIQIANLPIVKKLDIVHRFRKDNFEEESENDLPQNTNQNLSKPEGLNSYNYGQSFTQLNQITVPQVHDLGYSGAGVTICMMDAGFDIWSTHQVFDSMNVIATWDFVNGDPDVENGSDMGDGSHGTATLSLIGGFYPGQLIGPAFGANFILTKTENTESETPIEEDNWIAAMEWADSIGVDVTSTSLSYLDFDPPYQSYTWQDMDGNTALITNGADYAVYIGIFVVNSAGNNGYVAPPQNTLGAPADGDSVMAAGSVKSDGTRSSFSSVGPTFDGRIKPDLMAMGSNDYHACNWSNNCYGNGSGTSYSCPLIAGCAALLLEVEPSLTPMQLATLLKSTASQSSSPDNLNGWGIINTYAAAQVLLNTTGFETKLPEDYFILRNYPNPFNPSTRIQFSVPEKSNVKIILYNILGSEIKTLFNDIANPGLQEFVLDGSGLSSGIYFVKMVTDNYQKTIKISLLK